MIYCIRPVFEEYLCYASELLPQSPENALNYNPWNSSTMDLSSSGSPLPPIEPTDSLDGPISPAPDQNVLQLPDFTGKIRREDEYPVGRGGFADVWRGILCLPSGECKVHSNFL